MANTRFDNILKMMRENEFEMDNGVSKELICSICKKVMVKACSSPCECRYCMECITKHLDEGNKFCPGQLPDCRMEIINVNENLHIDNVINSRISKLVVKCPMESCVHKDELRNIEDHIRTCTAQPVNCLYHNIGCRDMKSLGDKMKEHLVMENYAHTKYLVEWIDNVTNEMGSLRKYIGELQGEINNLKEKDRQNQVEIVQLTTKSDEQARQISQWKDKSDETKRVTDEKLQQTSITMEQMHQSKADLESKFDQIILTIENVKEKSESLDVEMCKIKKNLANQNYEEFVWIIADIRGKIKQAKDGITTEVCSNSFYTHKNGYKMCLKLNPDGFGGGRGSHLSVFFRLMKGPFDKILSWPFKHDVTFSLMDQQSGLVHVTDTIKYDDDPDNSDVYMKPVNNINNGLGRHQFIRQNQLLSTASLVKDNKIIIKCSVTIG